KRVAETFAKQKPSTLIWAMGQTQHTTGTANVRASCILLLATGNVGGFGNGANIFRGHTNVQGATDLGLDIVTLPLYYGLAESRARHATASTARSRRPGSDVLGRHVGAQERHLPAAGRHELRGSRLAHELEPLAAMGRADRQAGVRIEERSRDHVPVGQEAR